MKTIQYSVRGIPRRLDDVVRRMAREEGRSLNQTVIEALQRGLGVGREVTRCHDLDDLAGTWVEDPKFDKVMKEMDQVDPEIWR